MHADVNECEAAGKCSQFCLNSQGSYSCSCADGYTLQSGSVCKANGGPAYLLLADQHSIQKIPISKDYGTLGGATILAHSLPQTLAIDFDIRYSPLIHYSTKLEGIKQCRVAQRISIIYLSLIFATLHS